MALEGFRERLMGERGQRKESSAALSSAISEGLFNLSGGSLGQQAPATLDAIMQDKITGLRGQLIEGLKAGGDEVVLLKDFAIGLQLVGDLDGSKQAMSMSDSLSAQVASAAPSTIGTASVSSLKDTRNLSAAAILKSHGLGATTTVEDKIKAMELLVANDFTVTDIYRDLSKSVADSQTAITASERQENLANIQADKIAYQEVFTTTAAAIDHFRNFVSQNEIEGMDEEDLANLVRTLGSVTDVFDKTLSTGRGVTPAAAKDIYTNALKLPSVYTKGTFWNNGFFNESKYKEVLNKSLGLENNKVTTTPELANFIGFGLIIPDVTIVKHPVTGQIGTMTVRQIDSLRALLTNTIIGEPEPTTKPKRR